MTLPNRSVWIDVQGCQNTANFERGIARQAAESTEALLRIAPDVIHTVGLTPLLRCRPRWTSSRAPASWAG